MYKTFKITSDWLIKEGACSSGIAWFNKTFPKGLTISNSQEEMIEMVLNLDLDDESYNYLYWLLIRNWFYGYIGHYPYGNSFGSSRDDSNSDQFNINDVVSMAVFLSDLKVLA